MSDDLVKRLRNTPNWKREEYGDYKSARVHYDRAPFEAADRIEELEAKLTKAVEALMFYGGVMPNAFLPIQDGGEKARTTLAELKGETS